MKFRTLWFLLIFSLIATIPAYASWTLYGVNSADDGLSRIDPATGAVTFIGALDPDPNRFTTPVAMAVRTSDGKIFVWNNSEGASATGVLLTVDPATGRATPVSPNTPPQGQLSAIAFAPDGRLFGVDYALYQIDPATGQKSLIGSLGGQRRVAGADFTANGVLYGITFTNELVKINTTTGAAYDIRPLNQNIGTPGSIVFHPETGTLIGSGFNNQGAEVLFDIESHNLPYGIVSNIRALSGGFAPQGMGFARAVAPLYMSLSIEDALEGTPVNKIVGDTSGPTHYTRIEIVAKLISFSSSAKNNIPVTLTIPGDLFGGPSNVWVRNSTGGALSSVGYTNLGGGRYQVTTDLSPVTIFPGITLYYRKQIVWRFLIPNDTIPQNITVNADVGIPCTDPSGSGTVRILAPGSVDSLIIANRKLLYDKCNESQVSGLLERLFTEAQGPPASHSPRAVIYYIDRYDSRAYNWDNTTVDYTSEATANVVPNAVDALIEDWHDDATKYESIYVPLIGTISFPVAWPHYLLIVGDDDTIPFYRYNDPYDDEGIKHHSGCPAAAGWCVDSATNPAIHATDHDCFFTDNPYADLGGDWQTGDIELWTGRLVGASAADMLSLLSEGVDWNNGRRGGVVMASVDGWEVGLEPDDGRAGEVADLYNVPALFRNKGFAVRNDDIPSSEVRTIDVMSPYEGGETSWNNNFRSAANNAGGMDLFFIGGHDGYDHAVIPGDDFSPDDTPTVYSRFDDDHPISMIVGCHGGLPVPDIDVAGGVDHCMVYDLVHEGARAYIGASGFSYGSPGNLHKNLWGERLMEGFFGKLLSPPGSNSMAIGKALADAKRDHTFGFGSVDALDRKTVTEFNLFGVPWAFMFYPVAMAGSVPAGAVKTEVQAFSTLAGEVVAGLEESVYSQTFDVVIEGYSVQTEVQDDIKYSLFSVKGGDTAVSPGTPILPYLRGFTLPLPPYASVIGVKILRSSSGSIGRYNVPVARVEPWTEGGLAYTTKTDIDYAYPKTEDLIQYQVTGEGMVFTVFPIQHNPATDETTFYSHFLVEVTYEAPLSVAVTDFGTDKLQYRPGETLKTAARIENLGDVAAILWASLSIQDVFGKEVGTQTSKPFEVPSGGSYILPLSWTAHLDDGVYTAQISLFAEKAMLGGRSAVFSVVGREITDLSAPAVLRIGEQGVFKVTFANYGLTDVEGQARLTIQDNEGGFVNELAPQGISVPAGSSEIVAFSWTPTGANVGDYSAIATVLVDDQQYGPTAKPFLVTRPLCEGDFDCDGDVDGSDLARFVNAFVMAASLADLNGDKVIDAGDVAVFAADFGRTDCPACEDAPPRSK